MNRLADVYNAVSVLHQVPLGGEDLDRDAGPPRLVRATGQEPFDTTAGAESVDEHPGAGEIVLCDDDGVTCRRWNWRQTTRTQLTDSTTATLFILDALEPLSDDALGAAADHLVAPAPARPRRSSRATTAGPAVTPADSHGQCPAADAGGRSDALGAARLAAVRAPEGLGRPRRAARPRPAPSHRLGSGMIESDLPTGPTSPLVRGLAACLSSVTEVPLRELAPGFVAAGRATRRTAMPL